MLGASVAVTVDAKNSIDIAFKMISEMLSKLRV